MRLLPLHECIILLYRLIQRDHFIRINSKGGLGWRHLKRRGSYLSASVSTLVASTKWMVPRRRSCKLLRGSSSPWLDDWLNKCLVLFLIHRLVVVVSSTIVLLLLLGHVSIIYFFMVCRLRWIGNEVKIVIVIWLWLFLTPVDIIGCKGILRCCLIGERSVK